MYHIHDELTYLTGYEIMMLNDKYLNAFLYLSQDEILDLCGQYNQLIKIARRDEDKMIEEPIEIEKDRYVPIKIKELDLYILISNCLDEIYDRNVRNS